MSDASGIAGHDLGPQLQPSLEAACDGRLSDIHWFRTDWQRGGAATAHAQWDEDGQTTREVVIKLPIGPVEWRFLTELAKTDAPVPRVTASGMELGGYDFAWAVMERLPGDPLAKGMEKNSFRLICDAIGCFYARAEETFPITGAPVPTEWEALLEKARVATHDNPIPHAQLWSNAIKKTHRALPKLIHAWRTRPINAWCHGDLHPGNALLRADDSSWGEAGCVLIDFAEVKVGNWVEDAVYLERVHWGRPELIKGVKTTSLIAKARKNNGLENDEGYAELANIRRVMLASCVPAFLHREGHPSYLEGALAMLEKLLPIVC